jgi:hypothetical protein
MVMQKLICLRFMFQETMREAYTRAHGRRRSSLLSYAAIHANQERQATAISISVVVAIRAWAAWAASQALTFTALADPCSSLLEVGHPIAMNITTTKTIFNLATQIVTTVKLVPV